MDNWNDDDLRERGLFLCDALPDLSLDETLRAANVMARSFALERGQQVEDIISPEQFARLVMPQLATTSAVAEDRGMLKFQTVVYLVKLQRDRPELFEGDAPNWDEISELAPHWLKRHAHDETVRRLIDN